MPDLLPELGLGLAVGDAGHEAGGEAARRGDAPESVILADSLLLQTLELHALVTSETCNLYGKCPRFVGTLDGPLSELKRFIPEGDDSIERCPAVLNPSVWNNPVPVWSRQAAVDLLKVIISKSLDHLDSQVHHLTLGVLSAP